MGDKKKSQGREKIRMDKKTIAVEEIQDLFIYFAKNTYSAASKDTKATEILNICLELMENDYKIFTVANNDGELCFQYPSVIPILESERNTSTIYENRDESKPLYPDEKKARELFNNAKFARCRQRFPVPVILFKGKYICRSATLSSIPEICYRAGISDVGIEALFALKEFLWPSEESTAEDLEINESDENQMNTLSHVTEEKTNKYWSYCDRIRNEDIKLLKDFNVNTIVDIMVEKRKAKHGLYVSSSEKVDKERFSDFKLISFPFPGCEFFKKFHDNLLNAEGLVFDWNHPSCDASLSVNDLPFLKIKWDTYKDWEIITMTQNYIKHILKSLQDDTSGMLLHCISGWDRTPLFISLIRLSLWADGLVHSSLDECQIIYLTVAYDWLLFGHHLCDRLYKGEEIFYFCFYMLKFISAEEFSVKHKLKKYTELDQDRGSNLSLSSNGSAVDICPNGSSDDLNGNGSAQSTTGIDSVDITVSPSSHRSSPDNYSSGSTTSLQSLKASDTRTTHQSRKTSPVPISVHRKRTESNGSTHSSESWQMVTGAGSVERDMFTTSTMRERKLAQVREIFVDSYFKTIKKETYGPPKRTIVEDVILYLAEKLKR